MPSDRDSIPESAYAAAGNRAGALWTAAGAVSGFLAVALGAFGAHALRARIPSERLDVYATAAEYHLIHSAALLAIGIFMTGPGRLSGAKWAARLMLLGIVLFSGSLYLLAITGVRALGAITPLGGIAFLAAWGLLAASAWNAARKPN